MPNLEEKRNFNLETGFNKLKTGSKIAVALSGGIDSLKAANMLLEYGYYVKAFHLKLFNDKKALINIEKAQKAAQSLNLELEIVDLTEEFKNKIINYFIKSYQNALTPSPCVLCNETIKFGLLLNIILENNFDFLASGHYAALSKKSDNTVLKKALDTSKNQSYFLSRLKTKQLEHIIWPLALTYKKDLIQKNTFFKKIEESQEICFIEDNYRDFLKKHLKESNFKKGNFINEEGQILGEHQGLVNYTIGQRRGLNVPGPHPYYVQKINKTLNQITLTEKDKLLQKEAKIKDIILNIPYNIGKTLNCQVQIRYKHKGAEAKVFIENNGEALIVFQEAQSAITPGQIAALYDNEICLGSGWLI